MQLNDFLNDIVYAVIVGDLSKDEKPRLLGDYFGRYTFFYADRESAIGSYISHRWIFSDHANKDLHPLGKIRNMDTGRIICAERLGIIYIAVIHGSKDDMCRKYKTVEQGFEEGRWRRAAYGFSR